MKNIGDRKEGSGVSKKSSVERRREKSLRTTKREKRVWAKGNH